MVVMIQNNHKNDTHAGVREYNVSLTATHSGSQLQIHAALVQLYASVEAHIATLAAVTELRRGSWECMCGSHA